MNAINLDDIPEFEQASPQGKYQLFRRHLSVALGGKRDVGEWDGGHPFDVEWVRLPSGARNFPLHQHSAQWEMYVITEGRGEVTDGTITKPLGPGDTLLFSPESAHQLANTGAEDLVYFVIATNQQADVTFYPQTGKWSIKPQRKYFRMDEVPYFEPGD